MVSNVHVANLTMNSSGELSLQFPMVQLTPTNPGLAVQYPPTVFFQTLRKCERSYKLHVIDLFKNPSISGQTQISCRLTLQNVSFQCGGGF